MPRRGKHAWQDGEIHVSSPQGWFVRVTGGADMGKNAKTGDAVSLKAVLMAPPEPVEPGAFDFGRTAWSSRLGAVGYATSGLARLDDQPSPPMRLALWAKPAISRRRSLQARGAASPRT